MKNKKLNLELIDCLTKEAVQAIEAQNEKLKQLAGASISLLNVQSDTISVQVNNVNGQRTSKVDLLNSTYKILSDNIPSKYRILIKL